MNTAATFLVAAIGIGATATTLVYVAGDDIRKAFTRPMVHSDSFDVPAGMMTRIVSAETGDLAYTFNFTTDRVVLPQSMMSWSFDEAQAKNIANMHDICRNAAAEFAAQERSFPSAFCNGLK